MVVCVPSPMLVVTRPLVPNEVSKSPASCAFELVIEQIKDKIRSAIFFTLENLSLELFTGKFKNKKGL